MGVLTQYKITRAEVDRLALEWCKAKHVVVMLDDVSRNFAMDIANKVLESFVQSIQEIQAAKKSAAKGEPAPANLPAATAIDGSGTPGKSSLVLTDL